MKYTLVKLIKHFVLPFFQNSKEKNDRLLQAVYDNCL